MLPPSLHSIHPLVALLNDLYNQLPSAQTVKAESSRLYYLTKARVSSFTKTRLSYLPSPLLPFPLPHLTKRLILVTWVSLTSLCFILILWYNSAHNNSHVSGDTSKSLGLHLLVPDESFGAIQSPPPGEKGRNGGGKDGPKKKPVKTQQELAEIEEAKKNFTLPKFWSVHDGTGRGETNLAKPGGVRKVMGLVFYGQRTTAPILDCYLKRNLIKNGGMLDGVIWVQQTTSPRDLVFLDKLIHSEPDYQRLYADIPLHRHTGYDHIEDDVMYIKIDDDIVFMEDTVIPTLVHTKSSRPDLSLVSANIVGGTTGTSSSSASSMNWIHWSLGAVKPYLPELTNDFPITLGRRVDWRASELPDWVGPRNFSVSRWASPGGLPHRWLPLRGDEGRRFLNQTPAAGTVYYNKRDENEDKSPRNLTIRRGGESSRRYYDRSPQSAQPPPPWQIAAQAHYSLLDTLETNDLGRYRFGLWDFHQSAALGGLHLVAMMGSDIRAAKPVASDDALHFAVTIPKKTGRHAVAAGEAVAAHYNLHKSRSERGIDTTDLLDRYRAFARENICKGDLMWSSIGEDPAIPWGS